MALAEQNISLAFIVSIVGRVLLVSYAATVATSSVPLQLQAPAWQLNLITSLVDNAGIALIGLLLIHGAALIDPRNPALQARRQNLAQLALAAAVGFLFTVPVLVAASVEYHDQLRNERVGRIERASLRLQHLRERITAASDHKELNAALINFRGQGLGREELTSPLEEVRGSLLAQLQQARNRMEAQLPPPGTIEGGPMIQSALRLGITALAYSVGFLAASRRPGSSLSVLEEMRLLNRQRRDQAAERRRAREAFLRSIEEVQLEQEEAFEPGGPEADGRRSAAAPAPAAPATGLSGGARNRPVDFDYYEQLSREDEGPDAPG